MDNEKKFSISEKKHIIALLTVLSIMIAIAGYFYYGNEEDTIRRQKQNELKAIAELKINQISEWYKDELTDARTISHNTFLVEKIEKFLSNESEEKTGLLKLLSDIKEEHNYSDIQLTSLEGKVLASTNKKIYNIDTLLITKIIQSVKTKSVTALDLYKSPSQEHEIKLGFISPVVNEKNEQTSVLVFQFEANEFLYPLIQYWPVPSLTSETFIFKVEADSIVYLNELKLQKNTALNLRLPVSRKELPAIQGALGYTGIFEGKDYRGVDILAYISPVPATPWLIVAKIDKSELFEGLDSELVSIIIITVLFILVTGAGLSYLYSSRQRNIYKELYNKEKELWQSQEKFKVTMDSLGEGVITADITGKIQYLNKIAEDLTGWKQREAKGRKLNEIYSVKNEETGKRETNIIEKVFEQGIVKELANHTLLISKSGEEIPVMDTGAPIYDNSGSITGLVLTFQDETEKRRQKHLLAESERRFRSSLDNMIEGCQILDFDWRYIYINDAATKHNRRPKEELLGQIYTDMWPGVEQTEVFAKIKQCLVERTEHVMENEFVFPDGNMGWFELKIQPIPDGVFILSYDITERKKMVGDLIAAKEKAEEINKVKSNFFANMSHELRTPFVGIMGYAELLSEILINPEEREMAQGILNTSERMKETLTKILNISKFEFNGIEVVVKEINVIDIINNVYKQFSAAAAQKNLSFTTIINFEHFLIKTDETLLSEILKNLVSNAIIYTNEGSIEIFADKQIKNNKNTLVIKVVDTGIGIPEDKQEIVWEEFRQASEGLTRKFQGTGLGLAIVKKYTRLLGGGIYLESEEGRGSTFTFELPVEDAASSKNIIVKESIDTGNSTQRTGAEKNLTKKKILHIEDDKPTIDVIRRALSKNYEVESAENSGSVLSKIKANKYDAILMDINLGSGIDGIELTQKIRTIPGYEITPIIAVTAFASDNDRKEFLSKGMSHYIAKPFMMQELLKLLEDVFRKR